MSTSEDVLLQIGEVRYKKGDGTLYVMKERLAWIAENRDTVAVSHRFSDIKMQKISPEGKPKVQLQVVLHDGNSSTFHFVNRNGPEAMIADRDKVKELLHQLLPNFKRKIDKDLEDKGRILTENANLLQLYKDLVVTKVVTSEEFWSTYAKDHTEKTVAPKQDIGVSGAFLADVKPQADGCNGLKYNLTSELKHSIFKTYPAVMRKHQENVPEKMTESEFWVKFFQSHYFHRDRLNTGVKDIFSECGKYDEQVIKAAVQRGPENPLLDLKQFEDLPLEEGYGGITESRSASGSGNYVHQNMIKRFNQHSIMVLRTCTDLNSTSGATGPVPNATSSKSKDSSQTDGASTANGVSEKSKKKDVKNGKLNGQPQTEAEPYVPSKKRRLIEKICYEDLGDPLIEPDDPIPKPDKPKALSLEKIERYLHGPVPPSHSDINDDMRRVEDVQQQLIRIAEDWNTRTPHRSLVSPTAAVNALGELSPGGALMRGFQEQSVGHLVPPQFEKDIRHLYLALAELLRQFWKCFPPIKPELDERAQHMHDALQRFKQVKLVPFENRAIKELSPLGAALTTHLNRMLNAANSKFVAWREKKKRMKR